MFEDFEIFCAITVAVKCLSWAVGGVLLGGGLPICGKKCLDELESKYARMIIGKNSVQPQQ